MSISPVDKTPMPQAPAPAGPPAKTNDHDSDDGGGGAIKPALDRGVGETLDKTA